MASSSKTVNHHYSDKDVRINPTTLPTRHPTKAIPIPGTVLERKIGYTKGLIGPLYQVKMLLLFFLKCKRSQFNFTLNAEVKHVGSFDDIFLELRIPNKQWILFQLKYSDKQSKRVYFHDIVSEHTEYSLTKYFVSYLQARLTSIKHKATLKYLVLCTSSSLGFTSDGLLKGKPGNFFQLRKVDPDDDRILSEIIRTESSEDPKQVTAFHQLTEEDIEKIINDYDLFSLEKIFRHCDSRESADRTKLLLQIEKNRLNLECEMREFLQKLLFMTKCPKHEILTVIIEKELKIYFSHPLDREVYTKALDKMLQWFQGQSKNLILQNNSELFEKDESTLTKLNKILSISKPQTVSIDNVPILFKEETFTMDFKIFAQSLDSQLRVLFSSLQSIRLNCLKLCQMLMRLKADFIVIDFSSLIKNNVDLKDCLGEEMRYLQFVFECDLDDDKDVQRILEVLRFHFHCKCSMIIILPETAERIVSQLLTEKEIVPRVEEKVQFNNFDSTSQKAIQSKLVSFQGNPVALEKIYRINDSISESVLNAILFEDRPFGKPISYPEEIEYCYIPRKLQRRVHLQENCLAELTEVFVFIKTEKDVIEQKFKINLQNLDDENKDHRFYFSNSEEVHEDQNSSISERNIHYVSLTDDQLVWHHTRGSLENLRRFLKKSLTLYDWDEVSDKVVVITADPGMGKSTLMRYVAHEKKELNPDHWIVYINLNDYTRYLSVNKFNTADDIWKAFYYVENIADDVQETIFNHIYNTGKNICIFIDSLDEISEQYEKKAFDIIKLLSESSKIKMVWVSTRCQLKKKVEDITGHLAFSLKEFNDEDQTKFLQKFWQKKNPEQYSDDNGIRFCKQLLEYVNRYISKKEQNFMGIPLQTRMVAEVFEKQFLEFSSMSMKSPADFIHSSFSLHALYKEFIERKFHLYHSEKLRLDFSHPSAHHVKQWHLKEIQTCFDWLAINILFLKDTPGLQDYIPSCKHDSKKHSTTEGIVVADPEGNTRFIHWTFSHYFAATCLAKAVKNHASPAPTLPKPLVDVALRLKLLPKSKVDDDDEFKLVAELFHHELLRDLPLHFAVFTQNCEQVEKFIDKSTDVDALGRTPLLLALLLQYDDVVEILLREPQPLNVKDLFNQSPISYILVHQNYSYFKYFYQYITLQWRRSRQRIEFYGWLAVSQHISEEVANRLYENRVDAVTVNILRLENLISLGEPFKFINEEFSHFAYGVALAQHLLVSNVYYADLKSQIEGMLYSDEKLPHARTVFDRLLCYFLPLHSAVLKNDENECKSRLKEGCDINGVDVLGRTPLHLICKYHIYNHDVVDVLLSHHPDLEVRDTFGQTPLVVVMRCSWWKCAVKLLNAGASLAPLEEHGISMNWDWVAHVCVRNDYDHLLTLALSNDDALCETLHWETDDTLLHRAVRYGSVKCVRALLKECDPNIRHVKTGETPLHTAVRFGRVDCAKHLLDKGADVAICDKSGMCPEDLARENDSKDSTEIRETLIELFHSFDKQSL